AASRYLRIKSTTEGWRIAGIADIARHRRNRKSKAYRGLARDEPSFLCALCVLCGEILPVPISAITGIPGDLGDSADTGDHRDLARIDAMKKLVVLLVAIGSGTLLAQAGRRAAPPPKTADKCLLRENINEDIAGQVAKFKLVSMPFSVNGLSDQERK